MPRSPVNYIPVVLTTMLLVDVRLPTVLSLFSLLQDFALYGRKAPGEKNDGGNLPALMAGGGVDGGINGQLFGGSGSASDVMSIDSMICHRTWDHRQVCAAAFFCPGTLIFGGMLPL